MRVMYCVVVMGLVFSTFNPLFWLARVLINCFSCKKKLAEFIYFFFYFFIFYVL